MTNDANNREKLPGYPPYPADEDIYHQDEKEPFSEDENDTANKPPSPDDGLDIPGADLDDADEAIGSEDEENNYYSIGGDNHNDLEEDQGDN